VVKARVIIGSLVVAVVAAVTVAVGALPAAADDDVRVLTTRLTGEVEVPGPGDRDGTGVARLRFNLEERRICYTIRVDDVAPLTAAHIHQGRAGVAGPVVVPLPVGPEGGSGCVRGVERATIRAILNAPQRYYVNVHNRPFPAGALRGQLG
jgi:hypothetical protein